MYWPPHLFLDRAMAVQSGDSGAAPAGGNSAAGRLYIGQSNDASRRSCACRADRNPHQAGKGRSAAWSEQARAPRDRLVRDPATAGQYLMLRTCALGRADRRDDLRFERGGGRPLAVAIVADTRALGRPRGEARPRGGEAHSSRDRWRGDLPDGRRSDSMLPRSTATPFRTVMSRGRPAPYGRPLYGTR